MVRAYSIPVSNLERLILYLTATAGFVKNKITTGENQSLEDIYTTKIQRYQKLLWRAERYQGNISPAVKAAYRKDFCGTVMLLTAYARAEFKNL